ncbi:cation:proton antiporter [Candidatus Woesearchaeota archaeon]|nr:cation:proton antiporter [Candidatus Woesearchaeota archaeon]
MNIFVSTLAIIFTAKILSKLSKKIGLSTLFAEFGAGLVLGISFFHLISPDDVQAFAHLGVILLMFLVGYETTHHHKLLSKKEGKLSVIALFGLIVTLLSLFIFGLFFFNLTFLQALFFTFAFTLTDVAVSARTLVSLGKVKSKMGSALLNIAVIDTIVGLLLFVIGVTVLTTQSILSLEIEIGKMAIFFLSILIVFRYVPSMFHNFAMKQSKVYFLVSFLLMFLLSYVGEKLELIAIAVIGAYFAGVLVKKHRTSESAEACSSLKSVAYGVFVPIFFAWVGLSIDLKLMPKYLGYALLICAVAIGIKLISIIIASRIEKSSWKESLVFGAGMSAKGADNLIILLIATTIPAFTKMPELIASALVVIVVVSIIFSSFALKKLLK